MEGSIANLELLAEEWGDMHGKENAFSAMEMTDDHTRYPESNQITHE